MFEEIGKVVSMYYEPRISETKLYCKLPLFTSNVYSGSAPALIYDITPFRDLPTLSFMKRLMYTEAFALPSFGSSRQELREVMSTQGHRNLYNVLGPQEIRPRLNEQTA